MDAPVVEVVEPVVPLFDIAAEARAKITFERLIKCTDDAGIRRGWRRPGR